MSLDALTVRANPTTHAFCALHGDFFRAYPFTRLDASSVELTLPMLGEGSLPLASAVPYDHRDRRALVVFDGDVPWGGLPKIGSQLYEQHVGVLYGNPAQRRKAKPYELPCPLPDTADVEGRVALYRRVIALPASTATGLRYRTGSLSAQYVFIRLWRVDDTTVDASFTTSTY